MLKVRLIVFDFYVFQYIRLNTGTLIFLLNTKKVEQFIIGSYSLGNKNEPRHEKTKMWFPNKSDTNQAIQAQNMARGWKCWIQKVEELYYPSNENKYADQLRGYA